MKVKSRIEAWHKADEIFPTDYEKDDRRSANCGYDIYYSTAEGVHAWISDLESRLEINLENGETITIWIEPDPIFSEYQIEDALQVISEAIYQIDDKVNRTLQDATGIAEARNILYGAYAKIGKILIAQHPESKLYKAYNLQYS